MSAVTPAAPRRAVVFGEALIDVFAAEPPDPDQRVVAGAPLHVATHLANAGWEVAFITRLGRDPDAERITTLLTSYGVRTQFVESDPDLPTGWVTVELGGSDNRFVIHGPAAWDRIAGPPDLPPHDVFCFGSLAARDEHSRAALVRLLEHSSAPQRVFDVNLRPPHGDAETLRAGLAAATVIKVNDSEFEEVPRLLGIPARPAAYFEVGTELELLCITRGPDGAELHDREGCCWSAGAPDVDVVDTVGAGDAFLAGLVAGLADGAPPGRALERGFDAAAVVLVQRGGLPTRSAD